MATGHCDGCGEAFTTSQPRRRWCSETCRERQRVRDHGTRTCERCNQPFTARGFYQRFCTVECAQPRKPRPDHSVVPWRQCKHCDAWFVGSLGRLYCSRRCQLVHHSWTKYGIERWFACLECGVMVDRTRNVGGKRHVFCSTPCSARFNKRLRKHRIRTTDAIERFSLREIAERDQWRCGLCHKRVSPHAQWPDRQCASIDHILPVTKGGTHTRANVQLAHHACNTLKGNRGTQQLRMVG